MRYRARNWPDSLSAEESAEWLEFRKQRLANGFGGDSLSLAAFDARLDELTAEAGADPKTQGLLDRLREWGRKLGSDAGLV